MSDYLQFDTSDIVVGGVNITEAIARNEKLVFNESYIVTGSSLIAPSLYACYDLTIIGNVNVDEIEVSGNLYVIGDIKAKKISCLKTIVCSGNIDAKEILGSEIVANDVSCNKISCSGNIIVKTTLDISESLKTENSVIAGEGIIGDGRFSAKNAVALEYFDFSGEVLGKVVELETDATFKQQNENITPEESFSALSEKLKKRIREELSKNGEIDEDKLVEFVEQLSSIDDDILYDWKNLTERVIELSYSDKLTNLLDYLVVVMAAKLLPDEIIKYETIEHVFKQLLPGSKKELDDLPFHAKNIEDFAYALKAVIHCENEIGLNKDEVLDRIFQSIGIKYKTVKSFMG